MCKEEPFFPAIPAIRGLYLQGRSLTHGTGAMESGPCGHSCPIQCLAAPSPPALEAQALPTSSSMPRVMALCQVLMMASESCWIRYSEPSRLRSWKDTSYWVISGSWVYSG
jgi:hypothetical protein